MVDDPQDEGSFSESAQDARQETLDYLSLAEIGPEEDLYPVDRSRSIFELIDESKSTSPQLTPVRCVNRKH